MTDEQIEKGLECCGKANPDCEKCSYKGDEQGRRCWELAKAALDYINRLKAENTEATELCKKKIADLSFSQWLRLMVLAKYDIEAQNQEEHDNQIRKETAKEIFQELRANEEDDPQECDCWLIAVEADTFFKIAKKYGVERKP